MKEKTVSEAVAHRRSTRVYDPEQPIDSKVVQECIKHASLAPTSSNLQLWEFYHITSEDQKKAVAEACFNQPAAKTALQMVVTVVRRDLWPQRVAVRYFLEFSYAEEVLLGKQRFMHPED